MDSRCPPHRTFAARAAYFGDRMCSFCDHRNPGDARYCNACASPLNLKPCKQCDAVNERAAKNCYKCGAACPVSFGTPDATQALPAVDSSLASATTDDVGAGSSVTQRPFAISDSPWGGHSVRPGQVAAAVIAMIVIVGAYEAYRIDVATPDVIRDASQPAVVAANGKTAATPAAPPAVESKPVEPEATAALLTPIPLTNTETPKLASPIQPPASVPAAKVGSAHRSAAPAPVTNRATAHQRGERKASAVAPSRVAHNGAAAPGHSRVTRASKPLRHDWWQVMQVSLARCSGDLFARIACDQRVRRHFCEGHWGVAPECASGVVNEHGQ